MKWKNKNYWTAETKQNKKWALNWLDSKSTLSYSNVQKSRFSLKVIWMAESINVSCSLSE